MVVAVSPRPTLVGRGRRLAVGADVAGTVSRVEQPGWKWRTSFRTSGSVLLLLLLLLKASAGVVSFEVLERSRASVVKHVRVDADDATLLTITPERR